MNTKILLQSTGIRNCYTQNLFYKLCVKLTREEWKAVKPYFKYYNFDGLKGWATTKPYDVARILVPLKDEVAIEINEKIADYEKEIRRCGEYDMLQELEGGRTNLKYDLDRRISASIKMTCGK